MTFTPTDTADYNGATATVPINVGKATPVITWTTRRTSPTGRPWGTQLNATAPVPGTFVYTPAGGTVLSAGGQTLSTTFTPTDTTDYNDATATVPINVEKATPVITWATPPTSPTARRLSGTQLNATAPVPGTFVYTPAAGDGAERGQQQTLLGDLHADRHDRYNDGHGDGVDQRAARRRRRSPGHSRRHHLRHGA